VVVTDIGIVSPDSKRLQTPEGDDTPAGRIKPNSMWRIDTPQGPVGYQTYNQYTEFTSAGKPGEQFSNKFNYNGFRYVIVESLPAKPAPGDAEALFIESDLEPAGSFECSNDLFNRIQRVNLWALRYLNLGGASLSLGGADAAAADPARNPPRNSMAGTPDLPADEWLGDKWFEAFGVALNEAEKQRHYLGHCDEYWWPSFQAKGRVLKQTTKISNAYFLADPKKQPLTIIKADTGIQTIVVPEFPPAVFGEKPTVIAAELQGGPIATVVDFVFPGMPEAVISGNEIRVKVPLATDVTKLAPTYRTGSPQVTGTPASGSTKDFTKPQTYTITAADGPTRTFVVTVTPTLGAVGVSNHSFDTNMHSK